MLYMCVLGWTLLDPLASALRLAVVFCNGLRLL